MAAATDTIRIPRRTRPDWAGPFRAVATVVRRWGEAGQLGASSSQDIRRATGAR